MSLENNYTRLQEATNHQDPIVQVRLLRSLKNDIVQRMDELAKKKETQALTSEEEQEVIQAREFIIAYGNIVHNHENREENNSARSIRTYSQELRVALDKHIDACQEIQDECRNQRDVVDSSVIVSGILSAQGAVAALESNTSKEAISSVFDGFGGTITTNVQSTVEYVPVQREESEI